MTDITTSHLTSEIPEQLLDTRETFQIVILDGDEVKFDQEVAVSLNDPYGFDISRFLPNVKPMSLVRFFGIAADLIRDAQVRAGVTENNLVALTEEYPPEPFATIGNEVICYRVLKREPASMDPKGTGRPQRKSTRYYDFTAPDSPNKIIVVESRPIDHIIEFSCWATSNKLANKRAIWLESLFINHAWAFEVQGAERFWWRDRGPDTYMTSGGQRLFYRPLNFFLRYREFETKSNPIIRQIQFEIQSLANAGT